MDSGLGVYVLSCRGWGLRDLGFREEGLGFREVICFTGLGRAIGFRAWGIGIAFQVQGVEMNSLGSFFVQNIGTDFADAFFSGLPPPTQPYTYTP